MAERAERLLDEAVARGVFPCAVAEAGDASGPCWRYAVGRLTFEPAAPPAGETTVFDLASLTKVLAGVLVAMRLADAGAIALDDPVTARLPEWAGADRTGVTVADLLEHASGLPAHRPYYLTRRGRPAFLAAIAHEPLVCAPRTAAVYSDLGFILLGLLLERAGGATLDRQLEGFWAEALPGVEAPRFLPPPAWTTRAAPTEYDPWRGRLLRAEVHDENAWAIGGVAAHAGLFGTAAAVGAFARWMLARLQGKAGAGGIAPATARRFATPSAVPGSSRALGWDTMRPTSSCGRRFSAAAIGHTGFTGTSLWLDPELDRYVVLLTNRVHPTRRNQAIQPLRPAFHDAVLAELS